MIESCTWWWFRLKAETNLLMNFLTPLPFVMSTTKQDPLSVLDLEKTMSTTATTKSIERTKRHDRLTKRTALDEPCFCSLFYENLNDNCSRLLRFVICEIFRFTFLFWRIYFESQQICKIWYLLSNNIFLQCQSELIIKISTIKKVLYDY